MLYLSNMDIQLPHITYDASRQALVCSGAWTILQLTPAMITQIRSFKTCRVVWIDAQSITQCDSAGVKVLLAMAQDHGGAKLQIATEYQKLLTFIQTYALEIPARNLSDMPLSGMERLGKRAYQGYLEWLIYLTFMGRIFVLALSWLRHPTRILWRNIAGVVETTGYHGLLIIGLLSFLVGIVLAYQMGVQLENYGANIFIVNLLGLAILREFAPLMTAIIIAGRTGAAFTAELGTMQVNQECDALTTMGISPIEYLVMPKIIGLMVALPLLSIWAAFSGLFGGMLMAKTMFGITFHVFSVQFQEAVATKQLWIGLMKTPVFAFLIASIGCFQGLQVKGGAEKVGLQTTRSVVQSLFLIIVADAFFSILLSVFHA